MMKVRTCANLLLIACFLAAIVAPLVGTGWTGPREEPEPITRKKASPAPRSGFASLESHPKAFKAHFEKNFGFRDLLVRAHSLFQVKALGISPTPRVLIGKDGWLFYNEDNALESYREVRPLPPEDLAQWKRALERRRDWLAKQNIRYLFVIAPNPPTIYPEFLPNTVKREPGVSAFDQLADYLNAHSDVEFLDLRPALRAAKARHRVYYRTDTHWNSMGAFVAYREIMNRISPWFPELEPDPLDHYRIDYREEPGGDLARFMKLEETLREEVVHLTPRQPGAVVSGLTTQDRGKDVAFREVVVTECPQGEIPRAVILRDSYADALMPFLSRRFQRTAYVWTKSFAADRIAEERPDLVIQEVAERLLLRSVEEMAPDDPLPPIPPAAKRSTNEPPPHLNRKGSKNTKGSLK